MKTFDSFADARACCPDGFMVSGTYRDGTPVYFHLPSDASDEMVHDAAFEAVNGAPMDDYQRFIMNLAKQTVA